MRHLNKNKNISRSKLISGYCCLSVLAIGGVTSAFIIDNLSIRVVDYADYDDNTVFVIDDRTLLFSLLIDEDSNKYYEVTGVEYPLIDQNLRYALVLPTSYLFYPVCSIKAEAFLNLDCLYNEVTIPSNYKLVGANAFENTNIEVLSILGATHIDSNAFSNCKKLTSVKVENDLASFDVTAFDRVDLVTNLWLSCGSILGFINIIKTALLENHLRLIITVDVISHIPDGIFANCQNIYFLEINEGVNNIGEGTFENCYNLSGRTTDVLEIPGSIRNIPSKCFRNCENLRRIVLPEQTTIIGDYAFQNCINIVNVNITNVVEFGNGSFQNCAKFSSSGQSVNLLDFICAEKIGFWAFANCNVSNITFGDDKCLKTLLSYAFVNNFIENVSVPSSVMNIGEDIFYSEMPMVVDVYLDSIWNNTVDYNNFFNSFSPAQEIHINIHSGQYTWIPDACFKGARSITQINLDDEVTSIGKEAFLGTGITSIKVPESVTECGNELFAYCENLSYIEISSSIASALVLRKTNFINLVLTGDAPIPDNAFEGCSEIISVDISHDIPLIGHNAFYMTENLVTVNFSSAKLDWTLSGENCFYRTAELLTTFYPTLPNKYFIATNEFANAGLNGILRIPSSVREISSSAFVGANINRIEFDDGGTSGDPSQLDKIMTRAFESCKIKSIDIPASIRIIEPEILYNTQTSVIKIFFQWTSFYGKQILTGMISDLSFSNIFLNEPSSEIWVQIYEHVGSGATMYDWIAMGMPNDHFETGFY